MVCLQPALVGEREHFVILLLLFHMEIMKSGVHSSNNYMKHTVTYQAQRTYTAQVIAQRIVQKSMPALKVACSYIWKALMKCVNFGHN